MPNASFSSGIRDNHSRGSVGEFLQEKVREGSSLSIVSAYFTIYAYEALKKSLETIDHLDFLFGEPSFINRLDPDKSEKKSFILSAEGLELANQLEQKRVAKECAEWIEKRVSIKTVTQSNLLHGKMYHVANGGVEEAILGSSNFTVRGLGLGKAGNNIELNLVVDGNRDRQELKQWFSEIWNDASLVKDVKAEVLLYLEQLYQNHPPEFIYYKTLFHIFEKFLNESGKVDLDLGRTSLLESQIWKSLFEFQKDGVKGVINKILAHNGCILADSVGLGKTYEALAVIKYFELRNERVLVLCPKKLRDNWTVYTRNDLLNPFISDRFQYDVLNHTDLSRETGKSGDIDLSTLHWDAYSLVVIDESHNFRNNTPGKKDEKGNQISKSRYERLMEVILKKGVKSKVLLLSATPVNNTLKDLRNQIYLLTEGNDDAFQKNMGLLSLKETLRQAQLHFSNWSKQNPSQRKTRDLLEKLGSDFFKLLDELTIARSRKHISKHYKESVQAMGGFPERLKPITITPEIDSQGRFLSYDKLNDEIDGYKLSLFNPSKYVKEEFKPLYQTPDKYSFTQMDREKFLIGMMKVNFLKRLESSVESFEITMWNTIQKINKRIEKIEDYAKKPHLESRDDEVETDTFNPEEEDDESLYVGEKKKYKLAHLQLAGEGGWLRDLEKDKDQLMTLYSAACAVTPETDAKLKELKKLIAQKVQNPSKTKSGTSNRKILVFTAFSDTATYLFNSLKDWARSEMGIHIALVTGGGNNKTTFGETEFNRILTNFSPLSKHRERIPSMSQEAEIDLLIATDCISEGQNLQDCDYLVNYDIHWNPVRIIQRFGRIDRIGSVNKAVQLVNFWPTDDLNKYINLKHRVEARMALVDIAATFDDNILKNDELEELIQDDLRYRDKQLMKLKEEVLDLEDLDDNVSLTEFTLDDFRTDLLKYLKSNEKQLQDAPLGLYTVVPPDPEYKTIHPGVLFCLKQRNIVSHEEASKINPLAPYFLVYLLADGNLRFSFAQPKQILEMYRLLCSGKTLPYESLCRLFDEETHHGSEMKTYSHLLSKALDSIFITFRKRLGSHLQQGRGALLPTKQAQVQESSEFELITWLVIQKDLK